MGEVFHVRSRLVPALQFALKLILPQDSDGKYRERFFKEAEIAAQLEGQHIALLKHFDLCDDNTPFAMWQFIPGRTLAEIVAKDRHYLTLRRALSVMEQVAAGLSEIHRVAIHRDIKPGNLMIRPDEQVVILDFGLAKPNAEKNSSTSVFGTLPYIAPEVFDDPPPDPSPLQDIYAAGIVMYELIVGHPPFPGNSLPSMWAALLKGPEWIGHLRPDAHESRLHNIVKRALARQPDQRFQSSEEFRKAIVGAIEYIDQPSAEKTARQISKRQPLPPLPPPLPPQPLEAIKPAFDEFLTAIQRLDGTVTPLPDDSEVDPSLVRMPKFMLFRRSGQVVMAVVPAGEEVNDTALQKTFEPQAQATVLTRAELRRLGFAEGQVHPIFKDPSGSVARIIVDAIILAQGELFPESLVMLPLLEDDKAGKMLVQCHVALTALHELHGGRLMYGNILRRKKTRPDPPQKTPEGRGNQDALIKTLLSQQPVKMRFAPTPSGLLHMGNARTALATYLLYRSRRKQRPTSQFHIRIDDTDPLRVNDEFVGRIMEDLRAVGIDANQYESFRQADFERDQLYYSQIRRLLEMAGLVSSDAAGVTLPPGWSANYHNLWFDWRDGPTVDHAEPESDPHTEWDDGEPIESRPTERMRKSILLIRPNVGRPFYRYAGIADDILPFVKPTSQKADGDLPVSYVVRDNKQRNLTKIQAHIRAALEEARKRLRDHPDAQRIFESIGIDHRQPLRLPIYLHLPLVVSAEGRKLSKSSPDDEYVIAKVLRDGILHEALVAYLIWTLVRRPSSGRPALDEIARFAGRYGVECTIARYAEELDPTFLTDNCEHPIPCDLHLMRKGNVTAIRAMLPWTFRQRLRETAAGTEIAESFPAVWRFFRRRHAFADWNQVIAVARGPVEEHIIRPTSRQICLRLLQQPNPIKAVHDEVAAARIEIKKNRCTPGPTETSMIAVALLQDMRLLLTGVPHSPSLHEILAMLDSETVINRLRKAELWTT